MKIGVLALQGDFREHILTLNQLGVEAIQVRLPRHLVGLDGIILPGGESTAIGKLMVQYELATPLHAAIVNGLPTWGTCAGMILLARSTDNALAGQPLLSALDIHVCRNAFGAQRESFTTELQIPVLGSDPFRAVFIRAPIVLSTGPEVEVLATLPAGLQNPIVAVRQGNLFGTAFHPEIAQDYRFHRYFLKSIQERGEL